MEQSNSGRWEPDPSKLGNWREQLMKDRGAPLGGAAPQAPAPAPIEFAPEVDPTAPDPAEYKPWIVQRGRSQPAMMLEFRRYEPRSGLWSGWAISYPHLVTLEYTGDKLLSLDFGSRHVVIEGQGLDELARYIQQGVVLTIQEHAAAIWSATPKGPAVSAIRNIKASRQRPEEQGL